MKRSSPSSRCHFLTPTRPLWWRSSKMARMRAFRRSVSSSVPWCVSRIHPKISLHWLHPPSPFRSFFSETASFRWAVARSGWEKTLSTACMIQRRTFRQRRREPWARLMKSSTKTSTCAMGPLCFVSGTRSSGCDMGGASSASSERGGADRRAWSSGCGNGDADAETGSVVNGLKGGCGPRSGCGGGPQQS